MRSSSAPPLRSTATSQMISLNCAGAGSTAGSRASPTVSTTEPPVRVFVMGGGSGRRNRDGRLEHGGRLAQRRRVAVAADPLDPASTCRPTGAFLQRRRAGSARSRLCLRSARSGADDRRRDQLGRAGHACRRLRPTYGPACAARRARRRTGVHDAAARRGSRSRPDRSQCGCGSPRMLPTPTSQPN